MDCRTCEKIQLAQLAGDASAQRLKQAKLHGLECEPCRRDGERDRRLDSAFLTDRQGSEKGFPAARRKLEKDFRERHAFYARVEGPFGPVYLASTAPGPRRVRLRPNQQQFARRLFSFW